MNRQIVIFSFLVLILPRDLVCKTTVTEISKEGLQLNPNQENCNDFQKNPSQVTLIEELWDIKIIDKSIDTSLMADQDDTNNKNKKRSFLLTHSRSKRDDDDEGSSSDDGSSSSDDSSDTGSVDGIHKFQFQPRTRIIGASSVASLLGG